MQPASSQRTRASGIDQVHLEGTPLELAGNPPPAGRRLNRDRGQLSLPRARPLAKALTRRRETTLAQLARIRVEHHCLKNSLVNIDPRVQHPLRASLRDRRWAANLSRPRGPLHYIPEIPTPTAVVELGRWGHRVSVAPCRPRSGVSH